MPGNVAGPGWQMNRRVLAATVLGLALIAPLQSGINGQGAGREPRTLSGTVYYAGGNQPAENITVELHSTEGSLIAPIVTAATGWFEFHSLQRGMYVIAINASGFEPVNFNVDLTFNSSRGNVIYLESRSSNSAQSPSASSASAHELSMPQKARDLMVSGKKKLYGEKNAQAGLAEFEKAVSIAPGYYEAYYQMGMADVILSKHDDAERSFRKSIQLSSDTYGEADIALGTLMLDKGAFAEGERAIRHGIEFSPDSWLGQYELGRALLNENRIDEAEKPAERARSLAPNVPIVYRLLSNIHLRKENYPALLADVDAYIRLDPDSTAGVRAKQIRDEVQQKFAGGSSKPAPSSKP